MGVLDGPAARVADKMIAQFGRSAVLRRPGTPGTYDPDSGTYTGGSDPVAVPCSVVFSEFGVAQIDGSMVEAGDRKALVSRLALTDEPNPGRDTLLVDGQAWVIVRVVGFSSGEREAAYELQVRR